MTIAIDISQIVYGTGVSVYVKNLVTSLLRKDKKNQYLLFAGVLRERKKILEFIKEARKIRPELKARIYPFPPRFLDWLWNKKHFLPLEFLVGRVDIFLASDWTQPPAKKAKVVSVVHDLIPWLYPETQSKLIVATHKRRMAWVKKEAVAVITDSLSTKKDFLRLIGYPAEKVYVAYPGVDHKRFSPCSKKEVEKIKKKYHLSRYILAVGTQEPRKNFARVIRVFKRLGNKNLQLAIVGKYGWGKDINISQPNIKRLGYVPDDDLPSLYSGALCFVYPSLYEGFGLPVLEAMACGCPVITSSVSSLPEVAGKAAVLVDPTDETSLLRSLRKIIYQPALAKTLSLAGKRRASQFSWEKTAQEFLSVFKQTALKKML